MKPVRNEILFKPLPSPEITEGGLFVPENARPINNKGTIVAVGNGTKERPMRLKVNDVGYRVKDWGTGFTMDGEVYFLMDEKAIIAID